MMLHPSLQVAADPEDMPKKKALRSDETIDDEDRALNINGLVERVQTGASAQVKKLSARALTKKGLVDKYVTKHKELMPSYKKTTPVDELQVPLLNTDIDKPLSSIPPDLTAKWDRKVSTAILTLQDRQQIEVAYDFISGGSFQDMKQEMVRLFTTGKNTGLEIYTALSKTNVLNELESRKHAMANVELLKAGRLQYWNKSKKEYDEVLNTLRALENNDEMVNNMFRNVEQLKKFIKLKNPLKRGVSRKVKLEIIRENEDDLFFTLINDYGHDTFTTIIFKASQDEQHFSEASTLRNEYFHFLINRNIVPEQLFKLMKMEEDKTLISHKFSMLAKYVRWLIRVSPPPPFRPLYSFNPSFQDPEFHTKLAYFVAQAILQRKESPGTFEDAVHIVELIIDSHSNIDRRYNKFISEVAVQGKNEAELLALLQEAYRTGGLEGLKKKLDNVGTE
ncbi:hypothetical protein PsorP6_002905 [Peronosclerospora sorghi]|uniref:Uncharacterized protein n=1 Tax=Peronosclerospora sorghi TaxID=230839 RepID=A0ACC0VJN3_9STRA|nr:hypothetical protein PsorP6_002905 [Peronosclerospora sorghi]